MSTDVYASLFVDSAWLEAYLWCLWRRALPAEQDGNSWKLMHKSHRDLMLTVLNIFQPLKVLSLKSEELKSVFFAFSKIWICSWTRHVEPREFWRLRCVLPVDARDLLCRSQLGQPLGKGWWTTSNAIDVRGMFACSMVPEYGLVTRTILGPRLLRWILWKVLSQVLWNFLCYAYSWSISQSSIYPLLVVNSYHLGKDS